MELRHIRYFLAVAEEQHFTRAAAKVGIGQPPLSQQIKDLEREVGAALFHRLAHGAELTEAGKAFLAGVKDMPLIAERATMAARRAARGETGSLRVGFTASAAFNVVVPSAIRAFRRAYPEIYLTLEEANTTRLVSGLREGTLDAVFLRPGTPGSEELQLRPLSEEPMVVALPERHSAAALEEIELKTLKQIRFYCSRGKSVRRFTTRLLKPVKTLASSRSSASSRRELPRSSILWPRSWAYRSCRRR